jgi:hypothetical protein
MERQYYKAVKDHELVRPFVPLHSASVPLQNTHLIPFTIRLFMPTLLSLIPKECNKNETLLTKLKKRSQ